LTEIATLGCVQHASGDLLAGGAPAGDRGVERDDGDLQGHPVADRVPDDPS
jgi:hypothetical protein